VGSYIVTTKLTVEGAAALVAEPERLLEINARVEQLGVKITRQYFTLGRTDVISFIEAPDNATVASIAAEIGSLGTMRLSTYPAIGFERFTQLLRLKPYRTEPHRWQTQLWARMLRRGYRTAILSRHMRRLCQPLTIEGGENVAGVTGSALIIANHTSHFDTPVLLTSMPAKIRGRTAVAAAADRFYRPGRRSWWFSLFWNTYPIARGGGMKALDYSLELLKQRWSILIFPEGGRFKPGQVQRFHHGATILAMQAKVPVIPVYLEGLHKLMPKGQRHVEPGPASVRIGAPVSLDGVASVPEGTAMLEQALRSLAAGEDNRGAAAAG
jgi:1-acyl-sn-glycerol-3-phosphate acyltransferase